MYTCSVDELKHMYDIHILYTMYKDHIVQITGINFILQNKWTKSTYSSPNDEHRSSGPDQ